VVVKAVDGATPLGVILRADREPPTAFRLRFENARMALA